MTAAPESATRRGAAKTPLPAVFWALWLGTLVNRIATFVAPFLMLYLVRDRGVAPVTASVLLTVQGIGLALSNVAGGWLADRAGRRGTMITGLVTTAGIMALLPAAGPLWTIAALVAALGLTADLHRPALNAFVADVVSPDERARELHVKMAGLSADAQKHFGYFAVCYYEVIAYAVRERLRTVLFGPLTYQAKVARGCLLAPRSTYVRVPAGLTGEVAELAGLLDRHHRATFAALGGVR